MKVYPLYNKKIVIFLIILLSVFSGLHVEVKNENNKIKIEPKLANPVKATYQFTPSGGQLVTGTAQTIVSATAASTEGVNTGSWKGTLGDDDYHWTNASTSGGYDVQLILGGAQLNGANTMIIQSEFDLDATAPSTLVQICDWVTSTSVDNTADAQCTTGGWRTINNTKTGITTVTPTAYTWYIYDGFWADGSDAPVSTPLSNFINGSNEVRIRYYSTTNTTSVVSIDFLRIFTVVNSVYTAADTTNLGSGGVTGEYTNTTVITQGASDNTRYEVAGTAGSVADMYFSFKNVKTLPGMNTILVRAEYSCSAGGINHRPKIYNFNSAAWEDLTTASIACSTTDGTFIGAKNNVTLSDYISSGEIRVGWRGLSNATTTLRFDQIYIMVGSTNTDTGGCEITFGTNSAGDCSNTRDIDSATTANTWNIATEDESNTLGHDFYYGDTSSNGTVEEAGASTVEMPIAPPSNVAITGILHASRHMSGVAGTVVGQVRMYGQYFSASGGGGFIFTGISGTSNLNYSDNITIGGQAWGGPAGGQFPANSQIDSVGGKFQMRLSTSSPGATSNNSVNEWDFVMMSLQWTEDDDHPSSSYHFNPTGGQLVTGTAQNILAATAVSSEGLNTGSWRGTIGNDDAHWAIASTSGGYDAQLVFGDVALNGANRFIFTTEFDLDATAPDTLVQICDWENSASVDHAADAQCTGGGWRTINNRDVAINTTTPSTYSWYVYDGYWSDGSNGSIATPLTNFVNGSDEVRIRYYSTTNTTSVVSIDYMMLSAVINPVYTAAGFTNLGSGSVTGDYMYTNNVTNITGSASDNVRLEVAGTAGSVADFYLSFKDIKVLPDMNAIFLRMETSCSTTGINYRTKIYNFNSSSWEDLNSSTIACSATDGFPRIGKTFATLSNYISNGEMRIGLYGLSNSTIALRVDVAYLFIGTTNVDTADCEISFGTNSAGDCSRTRDFDSTIAASSWQIATEDESNTFGHDYYALDNDGDGTVEEASASHIKFPVTLPVYTAMTNLYGAYSFGSGTGGAVNISVRDYGGVIGNVGGYSHMGISAGTTSVGNFENIQSASYSGSLSSNSEDFIDTVNNEISLRLRTGTSGATSNNSINDWDFALIAPQWVETKPTYTQSAFRFFNNADSTDVGSALAAQDTNTTLVESDIDFRLRMLIHLNNDDLRTSQNNFKLQYVGKGSGTCSSPSGGNPSSYTDVTGSTLIAYYDNYTPTDGAALTTNANDPTHGSHTIRQQTYEESNNFTSSQKIINSGQDGLWDFYLLDNSAPENTTYCFRIVESDGTVFSNYNVYPEITTTPGFISMTINDNTVGFGALNSGAARYATGDTLGSASDVIAHSITIDSNFALGWIVYVRGATLTSGPYSINAIGGTATASSPGTEQFGVRYTKVGGFTPYTTSSPYDTANFAYAADALVQDDIGFATGGGYGNYNARYLANISSNTEAGNYSTTLIYTVVGDF
jgi:hypothetical protein